MSETKRNGWQAGWGNGLSGPTTPNVGGPTVAGSKWGFGVVSRREETIAICPDQVDMNGNKVVGSGEEHARLIAAAPDLLDALKPFAAWANDVLSEAPSDASYVNLFINSEGVSHRITFEQMRAVTAAIAKVEGSLT